MAGLQAHLWEVVNQELPDGRCLEHIDAHASNVGQLLGSAGNTMALDKPYGSSASYNKCETLYVSLVRMLQTVYIQLLSMVIL